MSTDTQSNNKRIAKNTAFLYIRMFFVLLVSLYTSRVVLNTLGVEDFGIYNVVGGFVSMFAFMNATLSSSIQRFFNYEGTRTGENGYKKVYSAGLVINIVIAILLFVLLESFGLWYINNVMIVPDDRIYAANYIYQVSVLSAIFVIMQIPYTGVILAKEHMDFYAIVSIIDVILKLFIVLGLPYIAYDKLISYSSLILVVTVFNTIIYYTFVKKKYEYLTFSRKIDKIILKKILSFSGWNLIGTLIYTLKDQGLNMMLNVFFGPVVNAARGVAYQILTALRSFTENISTAFRPQVVNSYADNNARRTNNLIFLESKVCFFMILFLITPIITMMDYILNIWLDEVVPEKTNIFATLVLLDALVRSINAPCTQGVWATGDIKKYQIVTSVINCLLLPCCYVFLCLGYEAESVFIITIIFAIVNQVGCVVIANKLLHFGVANYLTKVVCPCICATLLLPIIPVLVNSILKDSFVSLLIMGSVEAIVSIPIFVFILLDKNERLVVITFIKSKIKHV